MKLKKRLLTAALTLVLVLGGAVRAVGYSEGDMELSDWAVDYWHRANDYCILNEYERGGNFTRPITRQEFADMLFNTVEAAKNGVMSEIDVGGPDPFSDTDSFSVYALEQLGIASGTGGGEFSPDAFLTREQAAAFMLRAGEVLDFTYLPGNSPEFADAHEISTYAREAARVMRESGLMTGDERGRFMPRELFTREQAAAVLVRFLEKNGFNYGIYFQKSGSLLVSGDFSGLNGKYRLLASGETEISFYQGNFAHITVRLRGERIVSAVYEEYGSGARLDLMHHSMDERGLTLSGRSYLGNGAYVTETLLGLELTRQGEALLRLGPGWSAAGYQKMNGSFTAYAVRNGDTTFFADAQGEACFTVEGSVRCITNRYIITEGYRYSGDTVDGAYTVYGVYTLAGECVRPLGLSSRELYAEGYLTNG